MTKTRDLADLGGGFIQAGSNAKQRTVESKLQETVSALDFIPQSEHAAILAGTSSYDATSALQAAFATGKVVDGVGGTYNVTPDTVIDTSATAGIGYGANKEWFIAGRCKNINYIGDVSFGTAAFFLGKHNLIEKVAVTGDARFSAWYTTFQGIIVSGTTYLNGDFPPSTNFIGCYYNTFINCDFNAVIVDQRYGPFNDNSFVNCQIETFLVKDSGNVGYNPGNLPSKDFHLNCFYGCEFGLGSSLVAPDGSSYPFVIDDAANVGGINRFIGCYMEGANRGFYGEGLEVDNLHLSGNNCSIGAGGLGYNSPLSGEGGYIQRDVPHIYPAGDNIQGGDWSILTSAGIPTCLSFGNVSTSVVSDSTEPTGLGKCVEGTASVAFGVVDLDFASTAGHRTLRSFAIIAKTVSGSWTLVTRDSAGNAVYGAASVINLADGWQMFVGHSYDFVRFLAGASGAVLRVSAISGARGSGVLAPATKTKPIIDLSGQSSYVTDYLASQQLTTYSGYKVVNDSTSTAFASIGNVLNNQPVSFTISVQFVKNGYPQYNASCTYRCTILRRTDADASATLTQLQAATHVLDISPVPVVTASASGSTVTLSASTGVYVNSLFFKLSDFQTWGPSTVTLI